ncbi:putative sporulation protein YtxC [Dethiobacter alkaliphilus]|uniref:putative sporulation protein YtxC n=1 Tax=Dethiobacter alkaliphilus TaxID=427926 RepID=UPI0022279919|nr:putative sporulation protein YtxC [Dethiobacter alkaliphilus]MCW3491187.1 putative sporulation protein YtxC [Dethiobacter alkaliphilus]
MIAIAVKYTTPGLLERLEEGMFFFKKTGCRVQIREKMMNDWPHYLCVLEKKGAETDYEAGLLFKRILAENLTDFVMSEQSVPYLGDILSHYYFYFPSDERREILALAHKHYENERVKDGGGQVYSEVLEQMRGFLEGSRYFNLHGFIVFRLRIWLELLRKCVDNAVNDFLLEKEYQEFIKLLKYFVALQEPKMDLIHVTANEDGQINLLDEHYQAIEWSEDNMQWDWDESFVDEEDQLVSMLITVAPHRVMLHRNVHARFPKAADTLKHVFENRVTLCKRCKLCQEVNKHLTLKEK